MVEDNASTLLLFNKFIETLENLEHPEHVGEIQVSKELWQLIKHKLGHNRPRRKEGVLWNFGHIDVPIVKRDNIMSWNTMGWNILYTKRMDDTVYIELVDVRINGLLIEDLTVKITIDEYLDVFQTGGELTQRVPVYSANTHHISIELDPTKSVSLVMYGLCVALKGLEKNGAVPSITIEGVHSQKPWASYTLSKCFLTSFRVDDKESALRSNSSNRVTTMHMNFADYTINIDEDTKPSITALLNEEETALAITALMKEVKSATPHHARVIRGAITYLQELQEGVNRREE